MSVVAGYFSRKSQPLATDSLRERVSEYRILPSDANQDFLTDVRQIRFGHLISKYKKAYRHQTPTVEDQDGNILMISGYLFPPDSQDADPVQHLLSLCVQTRGKVLETCEGEFVSLFVEGRSGTVHIVNDRFGACPFFLLDAEERTLFASNLAFLSFLAGGRLESDVLGWLQIFTWDHAMGSRTHLRDVRRLLPASHVTLSTERTHHTQYWYPRPQVKEHSDPTLTAWRVFEAFRSATERRAGRLRKGMIAMSGGLDSRMVAGALPEGADFSAWTFVNSVDTTDTLEVRVAAEVSRVLGIRHTIKPIPKGALSPQLSRDLIALTGGLIGVHHSVKTMQGISVLRQEGIDSQMGGAPANSLSGAYIPSPEYLDPAKTNECVQTFAMSKSGQPEVNLLGRLFRRDVLREHFPLLAPSLLETFEMLEGPTAAHRVSVWSMANRNFAFHFTCPTHSHPDVTEAQPHLGYEYTDLMLQLPAAWLYKKVFYNFMIYQCLPALREVIYGNTGKRLSGTLHVDSEIQRWKQYHRVRRFVGRSLRAIVPSPTRGRRTFLYDLLDNDQLLSDVAEIIRSRRSLGEILDVEKCTQFVADCRAGRIRGVEQDDARLLGTLTTMCYAIEFFDRPAAGTRASATVSA